MRRCWRDTRAVAIRIAAATALQNHPRKACVSGAGLCNIALLGGVSARPAFIGPLLADLTVHEVGQMVK